MQYVIANKSKALIYGIRAVGHRMKGSFLLLNEKELNVVPGQTLAEKVRAVDGSLFSADEIKKTLMEEGWK